MHPPHHPPPFTSSPLTLRQILHQRLPWREAASRLHHLIGAKPEGLVQRALQEFVFVHQFRSLREQLLQKAQADYTDDDIFEMVSGNWY